MRAKTAEVATDAPETAAKPAVENTVATPMPPGSQPSQRFAASNRARVISPWIASSSLLRSFLSASGTSSGRRRSAGWCECVRSGGAKNMGFLRDDLEPLLGVAGGVGILDPNDEAAAAMPGEKPVV